MNQQIHLVDHGRGLQLSTSRVTVQDLVPYFMEGCSHEEIMRWIPTLSSAEIAVVEDYFRNHKEALLEEDRRIRARNAARGNPPEIERIREAGQAQMQALRQHLNQAGTNGAAK